MKFGQCGIRTLIRLLHLCAYCCFCYSFLHLVFFFTNNLKMILFFFFFVMEQTQEKRTISKTILQVRQVKGLWWLTLMFVSL